MPPFQINKQLILACHFTGIYDVNRNTTLNDDDYSIVREWAESIAALQLKGIIFHNNFTAETCSKYQDKHLTFIKIDHNPRFKPNVYRYLIYRDFLRAHSAELESVFVTDVSDVVLFLPKTLALFFAATSPKPFIMNGWNRIPRICAAKLPIMQRMKPLSKMRPCSIAGSSVGISG
jgi:hypothetical protein